MHICMQHACMHTYIHTYIHACIHIYIHTYMHAYIYTYIHTCIYTCIHTYIHAHMHTYIHTCIHTYIDTHVLTYNRKIFTCTHAYIHTHIHTYKHAYTHTHIRTQMHAYNHVRRSKPRGWDLHSPLLSPPPVCDTHNAYIFDAPYPHVPWLTCAMTPPYVTRRICMCDMPHLVSASVPRDSYIWAYDTASVSRDSYWCCFYYFLRNSLVALLEALFAPYGPMTLHLCHVTHTYAASESRDSYICAYGEAMVSKIDHIIGIFCKRAL